MGVYTSQERERAEEAIELLEAQAVEQQRLLDEQATDLLAERKAAAKAKFEADWEVWWETIKQEIEEVMWPFAHIPDFGTEPQDRFYGPVGDMTLLFDVPGHSQMDARFKRGTDGLWYFTGWEVHLIWFMLTELGKEVQAWVPQYSVESFTAYRTDQLGLALLRARKMWWEDNPRLLALAQAEERQRKLDEAERLRVANTMAPLYGKEYQLLLALKQFLEWYNHGGEDALPEQQQ